MKKVEVNGPRMKRNSLRENAYEHGILFLFEIFVRWRSRSMARDDTDSLRENADEHGFLFRNLYQSGEVEVMPRDETDSRCENAVNTRSFFLRNLVRVCKSSHGTRIRRFTSLKRR